MRRQVFFQPQGLGSREKVLTSSSNGHKLPPITYIDQSLSQQTQRPSLCRCHSFVCPFSSNMCSCCVISLRKNGTISSSPLILCHTFLVTCHGCGSHKKIPPSWRACVLLFSLPYCLVCDCSEFSEKKKKNSVCQSQAFVSWAIPRIQMPHILSSHPVVGISDFLPRWHASRRHAQCENLWAAVWGCLVCTMLG